MTIQDTIAKYPALQNLQEQMDKIRGADCMGSVSTKALYSGKDDDGNYNGDDIVSYVRQDMSASIDRMMEEVMVEKSSDELEANDISLGDWTATDGRKFSTIFSSDILDYNRERFSEGLDLVSNAYECSKLLYLTNDIINSKTSFQSCFYNSPFLVAVGKWNTDTGECTETVDLVIQNSKGANTTASYASMFAGCSNLKYLGVKVYISSNAHLSQFFNSCKNCEVVHFGEDSVCASSIWTNNITSISAKGLKRLENWFGRGGVTLSKSTKLEYVSFAASLTGDYLYAAINGIVSTIVSTGGKASVKSASWDTLTSEQQTTLDELIASKSWTRITEDE